MADDIYGDVVYADDVLGAVARPFMPTRRAVAVRPGAAAGGRPVFSRPPLQAARVAQPNTSGLRGPMGFGVATWAIGDATNKTLTIEPQEDIRIERLVIDVTLVGVTNGVIVVLHNATIGTQPQSPAVEQPSPASMFARDVTYGNIEWQIAQKGTKVTLVLGVTAAPVGAAAVAAVGAFVEWVR